MELLRPYCSVDDVRGFIESNAGDDDVIRSAINRASRYIEAKTNRNFWFNDYSSSAYTVLRDQVLPDFVALPWEVITITEMVLDGTTLTQGYDEDYFAETGSRLIYGTFTYPFTGLMTVKGTFGYELDDIDPDNNPPPLLPGDIHDAAIRIAATYSGLWKKSVRSFDGAVSDVVVVQTVGRDVLSTLMKYKADAHVTAF